MILILHNHSIFLFFFLVTLFQLFEYCIIIERKLIERRRSEKVTRIRSTLMMFVVIVAHLSALPVKLLPSHSFCFFLGKKRGSKLPPLFPSPASIQLLSREKFFQPNFSNLSIHFFLIFLVTLYVVRSISFIVLRTYFFLLRTVMIISAR